MKNEDGVSVMTEWITDTINMANSILLDAKISISGRVLEVTEDGMGRKLILFRMQGGLLVNIRVDVSSVYPSNLFVLQNEIEIDVSSIYFDFGAGKVGFIYR